MNQPRTKAIDEKFCSDCGEIIKLKAEICPLCGVRQMPPPAYIQTTPQPSDNLVKQNKPNAKEYPSNGKDKGTAAILALLLGGIGIHKFYLGKSFQGILYLLFCWTFIPAIIAFIEFLALLSMSKNDFNKHYPAN